MTLKHGTRIEVLGFDERLNRVWLPATIFNRAPKSWGQVPPGWHRIKEPGGFTSCCHEDRFRIVDNRAS